MVTVMLVLSAGCRCLRPDGSLTFWGKVVTWTYPAVVEE